jgi:hypothetical protein
MSIPAGESVLVYWGGEAIPAQLNADFNPETQQRNISNKQSGKFEESRPARMSASVSLTILFDDNAGSYTYADLWADWVNQVVTNLKISSLTPNNYEHSMQAYITAPPFSAPDQENIECQIEFRVTGPVTYNEIPEPPIE